MALLSGGEQVPPSNTTAAGIAIFQLSNDGTELHFKLIIFDEENITMAHIHLAPKGQKGDVAVVLYPGPLLPGQFNGILVEGTITQNDLYASLKGKAISDLIVEILAGNAYVNVHTEKYPGGEIRGQIGKL